MPPDIRIPIQEQTDVASARRECSEIARSIGLDANEVGKVGIVVTEAATNLLKHGSGGDITARPLLRGGSRAVEVIASDRGRGMADAVSCFVDGYSTAGSPGTGLGAIARLSFFHQVYSLPDIGTVLLAQIGRPPKSAESIEVGSISLPYPGETACGDAWSAYIEGDRCRLTVADGLGHGVMASEAANTALAEANGCCTPEISVLLNAMHDRLRSSRGAAVSIVDIDFANSSASFIGVGNVSGCIVGDSMPRRQMLTMNGIVGHEMRKTQTYAYPLPAQSMVILHSDGIATSWSLDKYAGLASRDVSVIAAVLMRDFRRIRDDATVVVVRQTQERG